MLEEFQQDPVVCLRGFFDMMAPVILMGFLWDSCGILRCVLGDHGELIKVVKNNWRIKEISMRLGCFRYQSTILNINFDSNFDTFSQNTFGQKSPEKS